MTESPAAFSLGLSSETVCGVGVCHVSHCKYRVALLEVRERNKSNSFFFVLFFFKEGNNLMNKKKAIKCWCCCQNNVYNVLSCIFIVKQTNNVFGEISAMLLSSPLAERAALCLFDSCIVTDSIGCIERGCHLQRWIWNIIFGFFFLNQEHRKTGLLMCSRQTMQFHFRWL